MKQTEGRIHKIWKIRKMQASFLSLIIMAVLALFITACSAGEQAGNSGASAKRTDNAIIICASENIEYTDEVIEAQYVDDLTLLGNMKYIDGNYAYQDGRVYYRRYHEDSFEETGLWANYSALPEKEKEIVCIDADGAESVLFTDKGSGSIYLINDRFYMTDFAVNENGSKDRRLYSVDMRGNDRVDYGDAEICAVDTERKLLILEKVGKEYKYSCSVINCETGKEKPLLPDILYFNGPFNIKDYQNGWIYYESHEYASGVSKLCAVSINGEQREIIAVASAHNQESISNGYGYPERIVDIKADGERIYFIYGGYDGTANIFQGGILASVKSDGTDYKAVMTAEDCFYLCHDNGKSMVYFEGYDIDAKGSYVHDPSDGAKVWDVEADRCYLSDFPICIMQAYYFTEDSIRYYPTDKGALCRILKSEIITGETENGWKNITDIYAVPDDSGRIIRLAMDIGQYTAKWEGKEADYKDFYYADGFLYFKAEYNVYDKQASIGWRDGYRRLHTDMCRLKIGESEAEILHSY